MGSKGIALLIFVTGWLSGWAMHHYWPASDMPGPEHAGRSESRMPTVEGGASMPRRTAAVQPGVHETLVLLLQRREFAEAVQLYLSLQARGDAALTGQIRETILQHADDLGIEGHYRDAAQLLALYLRSEYRDIEALDLQSSLYYVQKDYAGAIGALYDARAVAWRPEDLGRIQTRIRTLVAEYAARLAERDDRQALLELYQRITQLEPDYAPYFINLARAQIALENYEGARQSLNLVIYDPRVSDEAAQLLDRLDSTGYPPQAETTTIPLTPAGDQFLVSALVNETTTVTLLIDTGASLTIIKPSTLDAAGLRYGATDRLNWFNTVNGTLQAPVLRLGALSLGGQRIVGLEVGGIEMSVMPGVDGLLGMNFLKHFQFFIDQSEHILRLSPKS
jgi:clan AA aspartic protease (TIGR02281 family)